MYNNLIYTNGCSFTEGDYYDYRTECWPWRLNVRGFDILNDAMGGGSNHRIMRTSMDTVTRMHGRIQLARIQKQIKTIDTSKWIIPPDTTLCEWINDGSRAVFMPDGHLLAKENLTVATKIKEHVFGSIRDYVN